MLYTSFRNYDEYREMFYPEDIWDLLDKKIRNKITYQEFSQIAYDYWYEYYLNDTDEQLKISI